MSITIERAVEAAPEVCDLIGELNDVLGAAYDWMGILRRRHWAWAALGYVAGGPHVAAGRDVARLRRS